MSSTSIGRKSLRPLTFVAAGLAAAALSGCSGHTDHSPAGSVPTVTRSAGSPAAAPATTSAVQGTTGSLVGSWTSSDGEDKVFGSNGACQNFFYDSSTGKALDIGGPSSCRLSSSQDSSGRYTLKVVQGGNRGTYLVEFHGDDAATVYTKSGTELYRLTRF
ncbi:MAG: hypothetical protein U0R77_03625 [Mycolicibacterium insubricum]|nr:hypothetical protein [Mycobacterium sp.]